MTDHIVVLITLFSGALLGIPHLLRHLHAGGRGGVMVALVQKRRTPARTSLRGWSVQRKSVWD